MNEVKTCNINRWRKAKKRKQKIKYILKENTNFNYKYCKPINKQTKITTEILFTNERKKKKTDYYYN